MPSSRLRFPTTFRQIRSRSPVTATGSEERVLETPDLVRFSQFDANDEEIEEALSDPLVTLDFDVGAVKPAAHSLPANALEQQPRRRFQVASSDSGEDSLLPTPEKPCDMPASSPPIPKSTSSHDSGIDIPSSPSLNARNVPNSSSCPDADILDQSSAKHSDSVRDIEAQTEAGVSNIDAEMSAQSVSDNTRASARLDSVTLPRMLAAAAFLVPEMEESHLSAAVKQVQTWSDDNGGLNILIKTILAKAANAEETKLFQNFVRDAETYLIAQGKLGKIGNGANSVAPEHDTVVSNDAMKGKQDRQVVISSQTLEVQTEMKERENNATPNSTGLSASSQPQSLQDQVDKSISHVLERDQLDKALAIWQIHQDAIYDHDIRDLLEKFLQSRASRDESQRFKALLKNKQDRFKIQKKSPKRKMRMVSKAMQTEHSIVEEPVSCPGRDSISTATQTDEINPQVLARRSNSLDRPLATLEDTSDLPVESENCGRATSSPGPDDRQQISREDSQSSPKKREREPDSQIDLISASEGGPFCRLRNLQRKRQKREEEARKFAKFLMQTEDGRDTQLYLDLLERSEQGRKQRDSSAAKIASRRLHAALSDSSSVCEGGGTPRSTPAAISNTSPRPERVVRSPTSATNHDTDASATQEFVGAGSSSRPSSAKVASPEATSSGSRSNDRDERSSQADPSDPEDTAAQTCTSEHQGKCHNETDNASPAQPSLTDCNIVPCETSADTNESTSEHCTITAGETYKCTYVVDKEKAKNGQSTFATLKPAAPSPPNIASPPRSPQLLHCKRCDYHAYGTGDHSRYCHGYRALRKANKSARRLEDRLKKQAAVSAPASTSAQDKTEVRKKNVIVETEEETYLIATGNLGKWNVRRGSLAYKSWR